MTISPREDVLLLDDDGDRLVVFKPAGLDTQPSGEGAASLVEIVARRFGLDPARPAWAVHRLDRATSGLVAMARSAERRARLGDSVARGAIRRLYTAVVHGRLPVDGTINVPLYIERQGRRARTYEAVTHYVRLAYENGFSFVAVRLETGRKHQIRRHFQHLGRPIVGDTRYGTPDGAAGLALSAPFLAIEGDGEGGRFLLERPAPGFAAIVQATLGTAAAALHAAAAAEFARRYPPGFAPSGDGGEE